MLKIAAAGATALCAGILCTTPYSLSVTPQGSVSLSLDRAAAVIGRPLTPMSVAGVHRRAMRRTYGVGANLGYHPIARAAAYGAVAAGAGYYGAGYGGWGGYGYGTGYSYPSYSYGYGTGYSYPSYGYGTGYTPFPGPFADWATDYRYPFYGYGTGYRGAYHPVVRHRIYATAAGVHHYRHYH
jgi:hypothetical protein